MLVHPEGNQTLRKEKPEKKDKEKLENDQGPKLGSSHK